MRSKSASRSTRLVAGLARHIVKLLVTSHA
jgi:hypothetical protein